MTTVLNPPDLAAEERFVLRNVSWETYEQLLKNYENCSVPRLTYNQGDLEIIFIRGSDSIRQRSTRHATTCVVACGTGVGSIIGVSLMLCLAIGPVEIPRNRRCAVGHQRL